ncbi:MAG: 50S ribosomal protein L6 [Chitinivibrionales bacterium]|nr:50S ribosomal protein L6 [Chitinivibrionales bacterium]MBD3397220.1 50S ribosomal protein L6 [Chitinivibrionales bacterium]
MSRVGKVPIKLPDGVEVTVAGRMVTVKGPKGRLEQPVSNDVKVEVADGMVRCTPAAETDTVAANWGLYRVLISNMVTGVSQGFTKNLEIVGVGYRAELKGTALALHVGYSHPVVVEPHDGITFGVQGPTKISVSGIDKQTVGQVAANIRGVRPPEPYKGKGIRYAGEHVRRKAGKAGAK